jgi:parallel beta-helix repeat protein
MNIKFFMGAAALLICVAYNGRLSAQANVVENEPVTIYVNGQTGSSSNPGTASEPVATIQQGINLAIVQVRKTIGAKVLIAPGVYPESITVPPATTGAAMTIQAQTSGTVFIDGAEPLTNASTTVSGVYTYSWTDTVTGCILPSGWITGMPPISLANEMLFVNGTPMTQVMSASQLVPGTFYVNPSSSQVELYPPAGTEMASAQVEVSARRAALTVSGTEDLVLRGLVFEHAASCMDANAVQVYTSSNVLFDTDQMIWNNWGGLGISGSTDVTVKNSTASYNGGLGFMGYELQNALSSNNEADYNNWRGEMVAFYDYAQGGFKFGRTRNITVTGQHSYNNQAEGLWFDTDNATGSVSGSVLVGNVVDNLKLEANEGPFTITGNTLCSGGVGVLLMDSAGITLTNNYLYGNQSSGSDLSADQNGQIFLAGNPSGRTFTNYLTGASITTQNTNITSTGNTLVDAGSGQYVFNTYLSSYEWTDFLDSFKSSGNTWWDSSNVDAFRIAGGKTMALSGWRSLTDQDGTSTWTSVTENSACKAPAPAYPDFAVLARNGVNYVASYAMTKGTVAIPLQVESFGFGTVQLSAPGLPSGVTASFGPSSLVSGNSTLTLTASSSATAQTVAITIFATSGSRVHTITLWVAIVPNGLASPTGLTGIVTLKR